MDLPRPGFTDPGIPLGFAPFGIQNIAGQIFVTYAMQNAEKHDDVAGPGNGFVDIFNTDGTFVRRFATRGTLNSPWGLAMSPSTFGNFHNDVLVGNFGDGLINAFTPAGVFCGQLKRETKAPIQNDGLWGLRFGNGGAGGDAGTLFFAAGIDGEAHGLFGTIQAVQGQLVEAEGGPSGRLPSLSDFSLGWRLTFLPANAVKPHRGRPAAQRSGRRNL